MGITSRLATFTLSSVNLRRIRAIRAVLSAIKERRVDHSDVVQEGLAVASIARYVVVYITPPRDHNAR